MTRILIADDSEGVARTTSMILRRRGYDTATASDGLEAVQRALSEHFDVILMDVRMPRLDGLEAHRRIRETQPDARVVLMTAYAVDDVIQQVLTEGVYEVLRKPLDMEKVLVLLERAETGTSTSVLLVDDHEATCATLRQILVRRGCQVSVASTGEAAAALAGEQRFDVAFIDMRLPTIDGLDTYLALKAVQPDLAAVIMTGFWEQTADRIREALESSARACMHKPLDLEQVLRMVDSVQHAAAGGVKESAG